MSEDPIGITTTKAAASASAKDGDIVSSSRKRRPFLDISLDLSSKMERPRFLEFHLNILRQLYAEDNCMGDGIWEITMRFLENRKELNQTKKQAANWKAIFTESTRVCKTMDEHTMQSPSKKHVLRQAKSSPVASNYLPPLLSQSMSGNAAVSTSQCMEQSNVNPFGVISNLLGYRQEVVQNRFRLLARPFEALLRSVLQTIQALRLEFETVKISNHQEELASIADCLVGEHIYKKNHKRPAASNALLQSQPSENERSKLTELQSKIYLWSLLAHDLQTAITNK
jgi:hypothetical protein